MDNDALIASLQDVPAAYRPVSFWFVNHFLRPDEIRRQIREQADKGFGGFMFHGREGLRSGYLDHEWEAGLRVALEEAARVGIEAWLYDENGYPSGIAGGKIWQRCPGRSMQSLVVVAEEALAPGDTVRLALDTAPLHVFAVTAAGVVSLAADIREWRNDTTGEATVLALAKQDFPTRPAQVFESYPDYLDPEVAAAFIDLTHHWYEEHFREHFGTLVKGIFTDNACAHFGHVRRAIPWSRDFGARFAAATGMPIDNVLPGLFLEIPGWRECRLRFWRFLGDEFIRTFVGPLRDWGDRVGLYSTGHYCLEDGLGEHVRQIGNYFDVMRHQSLNAVDQLGPARPTDSLFTPRGMERLASCLKNTSSAALFYDSPRVMCESFGLAGGWGLDLGEMRRITGFLVALGIDLFVPHGLYYSIAGCRKWECIPDHFHNSMWPWYREWTDWAARLSWLTAGWLSVNEVAVLHPTTTLQAHIALGTPVVGDGSDRGAVVDRVEDTFGCLIDTLVKEHLGFEIVPEDVWQRGTPTAAGLEVPVRGGAGACTFKVAILPATTVVEAETWRLLRRFAEAGGTVLCVETSPDAVYDPATGRLTPLPEGERFAAVAPAWADVAGRIRAAAPPPLTIEGGVGCLVSRAWEKWGRRFYLVHNATAEPVPDVAVHAPEPLARLDLECPGLRTFPVGRRFTLAPAETVLLVETVAGEAPAVIHDRSVALPDEWAFAAAAANILPLRAGTSERAGVIECHNYTFKVEGVIEPVRLLLDIEMSRAELLADRHGIPGVTLNGASIVDFSPGEHLDRWIFEADVGGALVDGVNRLVVTMGGGHLERDRQIWAPCLVGAFAVSRRDDTWLLGPVPELVGAGDWVPFGFPFYAGEGRYTQAVRLPEWGAPRAAVLDLGDLANAAEVLMDGRSLGRRVLPPWRFAMPEMPGGAEVTLEVRVVNTPANLWNPEPRPSGLLGGPVTVHWSA